MIRPWTLLRALLLYGLGSVVLLLALAMGWLRWDAERDRSEWFDRRKGKLQDAEVLEKARIAADGQLTEAIALTADTGLRVSFRIIRRASEAPRPVLILIGGHRTGSEAVALLDDVGDRAVVALDYPYDGPSRVRGLVAFARIVPDVRQAFLDLPPAVSLTLDWLQEQPWAAEEDVAMAGVSLGVPFAATAAARDRRVRGLLLVHGAADNRLWLERNIARRIDAEWLRGPAAAVLHLLVYGPVFDTGERVAAVAPRPVVIVGARDDVRTSEEQTRALFAAAGEPKRLRWTEGGHVAPGRKDIIDALIEIVDEELPRLAAGTADRPAPAIDNRATRAGPEPPRRPASSASPAAPPERRSRDR